MAISDVFLARRERIPPAGFRACRRCVCSPTLVNNGLLVLATMLLLSSTVLAQEVSSDAQSPYPRTAPPAAPSTPSSLMSASSPSTSTSNNPHMPLDTRFDLYLKSLLSPDFAVRPLLGGAFDQALDTPPQWGAGAEGFGKRVGYGFASEFSARTIKAGVAAVDHEDPLLHRSQLHGVWPRTRWAIIHTFINFTDTGGQEFAYSRFAAEYGSAFIANTWEPNGYNNYAHGLERGSTDFAALVGFHILYEFAPDLKKRLHFR